MATRSTIAIQLEDGTVKQVYCHWDGYLDHNGKLLLENYTDPAKIEALINHGQISSLRKEIGEKHDFDERFDQTDHRYNWTNFYGRDRGETDVGYNTFKSLEDYTNNGQSEEYDYIFRKGAWYVKFYSTSTKLLADAIADEMLERELAEDE